VDEAIAFEQGAVVVGVRRIGGAHGGPLGWVS